MIFKCFYFYFNSISLFITTENFIFLSIKNVAEVLDLKKNNNNNNKKHTSFNVLELRNLIYMEYFIYTHYEM